MATCLSCGEKIIWAVSAKGKAQPIDAEPAAGGNIVLSATISHGDREVRAKVLAGEKLEAARLAGAALHWPHHATCPQGGSWKWRKRAPAQRDESST